MFGESKSVSGFFCWPLVCFLPDTVGHLQRGEALHAPLAAGLRQTEALLCGVRRRPGAGLRHLLCHTHSGWPWRGQPGPESHAQLDLGMYPQEACRTSLLITKTQVFRSVLLNSKSVQTRWMFMGITLTPDTVSMASFTYCSLSVIFFIYSFCVDACKPARGQVQYTLPPGVLMNAKSRSWKNCPGDRCRNFLTMKYILHTNDVTWITAETSQCAGFRGL